MKSVIKWVAISIFFLAFISGCATKFAKKKDAELAALVSAFVEYNKEMEEKRAGRKGKGIKRLTLLRSGERIALWGRTW